MNLSDIRSGLIAHWASNYTETPTIYPNGKLPDPLTKDPFVALLINFTSGMSVINGNDGVSNGATKTRRYGLMQVVVFCPKESGSRRIYEIADIAVELLERKRIASSITMSASNITDIKDNGEYYTVTVEVPFKTSI